VIVIVIVMLLCLQSDGSLCRRAKECIDASQTCAICCGTVLKEDGFTGGAMGSAWGNKHVVPRLIGALNSRRHSWLLQRNVFQAWRGSRRV
ncbi:hypothetical protein, partial [Herbaspirillum autotrophicum]|uniref:hypothetical protein n=1 Tax=Herbaspirillum autotrophicum TaxID=180195 RepID=UPI001E539D28